MKNIDKIKEMNAEELIIFMNSNKCDRCSYNNTNCMHDLCSEGMKTWLEQEADLTTKDLLNSFERFCNLRKSRSNGTCHDCYYSNIGNKEDCKESFIVRNFNIIDGKITRR